MIVNNSRREKIDFVVEFAAESTSGTFGTSGTVSRFTERLESIVINRWKVQEARLRRVPTVGTGSDRKGRDENDRARTRRAGNVGSDSGGPCHLIKSL